MDPTRDSPTTDETAFEPTVKKRSPTTFNTGEQDGHIGFLSHIDPLLCESTVGSTSIRIGSGSKILIPY